jgi:hypothetical protein
VGISEQIADGIAAQSLSRVTQYLRAELWQNYHRMLSAVPALELPLVLCTV